MEAIIAKAKKQFQEKLPFVLYCKPDSAEVIGFFQQNDTVFSAVDFTEKGFVFASFDGAKTHLIPENESEMVRVTLEKKENAISKNEFTIVDALAKNNFEALVFKGIQSIKNNECNKVVLSRKETVEIADFDLVSTFEKLVQLYPSTFVYCFYHPKIGTWLGATPEQLLKATEAVFETISLAGTQKDLGLSEITWHKKEKEEQQFVTDYIVSKLESVASRVLVTEPYSVKAGSIWHIKTDISGRLNSDSSLQKVIQLLHPTPAVCGLPKESAKTFILENEQYDRSFYTGFLGELNSSFTTNTVSSDLFVNLRCMQIDFDSNLALTSAYLYMGCGITKDSVPEKEWEESVHKSMTMKKVL
ncbi:chorismate-binding protein [Flavobacterium sp. RSP15]|uniref:chorismate-binding protein n=1 Tax=Flavobacterium sp. RSP15 TaxID=2497485 RepID=UPI000F81CE30|nr:chorismate-binding protein [Flavobacterium sp. RSP15]RTY87668.1 isochorismate synthase [Flavobacterium sp. RSP15]